MSYQFILSLVTILLYTNVANAQGPKIKIDLAIENYYKVIMKVTNENDFSITMDNISFYEPFMHFTVTDKYSEPLEKIYLTRDYGPRKIEIKSSSSYEFVYDLRQMFGEYSEAVKSQCLVFHWFTFLAINELEEKLFFGDIENVNCPLKK